jgi:hypothetical protein
VLGLVACAWLIHGLIPLSIRLVCMVRNRLVAMKAVKNKEVYKETTGNKISKKRPRDKSVVVIETERRSL